MNRFMEIFQQILLEDQDICRSTFRTDRLGNRVAVPYGGTYRVSGNGKGIGVPKGWEAKSDKTGQLHAIPPGKILKIVSNGRGVVICPKESTREKKGQIELIKNKIRTESQVPSCLELFRWAKNYE
jgi:hypothetical protein